MGTFDDHQWMEQLREDATTAPPTTTEVAGWTVVQISKYKQKKYFNIYSSSSSSSEISIL